MQNISSQFLNIFYYRVDTKLIARIYCITSIYFWRWYRWLNSFSNTLFFNSYLLTSNFIKSCYQRVFRRKTKASIFCHCLVLLCSIIEISLKNNHQIIFLSDFLIIRMNEVFNRTKTILQYKFSQNSELSNIFYEYFTFTSLNAVAILYISRFD